MAGSSEGLGQAASQFGTNMIHGGGSSALSNNDLSALGGIANLQKDTQDPIALAQLAKQRDALVNKDNGGYLGALGRMVTGSGQTGGEQLGGIGLNLLTGFLRNQAAANAMKNSIPNMQNAQNGALGAQRAAMGRGYF